MIEIKLYLYDKDQEYFTHYRGEDLSKYVGQGVSDVEDITQEMDVTDITLFGSPRQKEYDPETKFIIDICQDGEVVKTLHRVVHKDLVSQPELVDNTYYNHHITFIEPSAIAQKRLVDNISATYKLKDVTLEELVAYPQENATTINSSSRYTPAENFGYSSSTGFFVTHHTYNWGKYFDYEGNIELLDENDNVITQKYVDTALLTGQNGIKAKFRMPKLAIYGGLNNSRNFAKIGYASIDYLIEEYDLNNQDNKTDSWTGSFISNSDLGTNSNYYIPYGYSNDYKREWLLEDDPYTEVLGSHIWTDKPRIRKYTNAGLGDAPTYITPLYTIKPDKQYKITIYLHNFPDEVPNRSCIAYTGSPNLFVSNKHATTLFEEYGWASTTYIKSNSKQTQATTLYVTYDIDTKQLVLSSANPYSALDLLQKAVMNCSLYRKEDGIYIGNIEHQEVPFYVDPDYVDELASTQVIENFYNQKNLWEILIEVGNYIHAVPEIVFGRNERFMITFNKLGRTDKKTNSATKLSIMNSKGMEDYVSACSSYVSNMVQLGGTIEELVSAKTTDETCLVSNDTANIIVSKPIIELLEVRVRCDVADTSGIPVGETRDMTQFVYEENVYKWLSIEKNLNPNRGIAMYYKLGTNEITGGSYQLPRPESDAYTQYAFKKIIYCAFFGYSASYGTTADWDNVKINNYSFFVKYRTKDSVRQTQTRPDLRKYILNCKQDNVPEHNQFNNQQDVVVDSNKFGNNMYGKLIRTGNSNYTITEWCDNYYDLKHKGELYDINGDRYYVSKATHTFFSNHIVSQIEYSKDYNQLSPIIGIPSEPRFYEISEQSLIWREVSINDYLYVTDDDEELMNYQVSYLADYTHLSNLLFSDGTSFAKYAITTYKGDKDINEYSQNMGEPNFYVDVLSPINAYSSENTLTYEWDTIDNFSAGDQVVDASQNTELPTNEQAYYSLKAVQYTDKYGKAALFDFCILGNIGELNKDEIKALPESPITTRQDVEGKTYIGDVEVLATNITEEDTNYNGRGLGLLKDCREALSMNYNLQLITSSDTFVVSPFFFSPNKKNVRIVLLSEEVDKLSNGYIDASKIVFAYDSQDRPLGSVFELSVGGVYGQDAWGKTVMQKMALDLYPLTDANYSHFQDNTEYQRIKAIAIICNEELEYGENTWDTQVIGNKIQFVIARNLPDGLTQEDIFRYSQWKFGYPSQNVFKNKQ